MVTRSTVGLRLNQVTFIVAIYQYWTSTMVELVTNPQDWG